LNGSDCLGFATTESETTNPYMTLSLTRSLETILVVEDNPIVMKPVVMMLEHAGFKVLSAPDAARAIQIESDFAETIHLLLSDVMMPGMAGPALAKRLQQRRPQMRVILMSGFTDGAVLLLNHGWHFIEKPFQANALLNRVNDVLHSELSEQETDRFDTRK
jgi:two-component system cell cycle sensor histidine kinase/response regulator CckA